jgi:Caspase domain
MKYALFLLYFCIICFPEVDAQISLRKKTTTRAVIVGISDYQNPSIPDLQFAHRDAQAFATFLVSPAGGNVPTENVRLMVNEKATTANFAAELDWLLTESKENDQAIIYFSGHGDVETKTRSQMGFLLTYDSPNVTYIAGAFPVYYLQEVVSTLSIENKAKVIILTDACHAGKLAGNSVNGSQATASNMARQFASEIKILSCQPNEFSNESMRWGEGRGVFSWYLVNGLYGLADVNDDLTVNLLELSRYLEDKIPADVAPQSQIPMIFGNRSETMAAIDVNKLNEMRSKIEQGTSILGFAKSPKSSSRMDSIPIELSALEKAFSLSIKEGRLVVPDNNNAFQNWQNLAKKDQNTGISRQCGQILAATMQSAAQQTFNNLILFQSGKTTQLDPNLKKATSLAIEYLDKTIQILGLKHFSYKNIFAKKTYLESMLVLEDLKINPDNVSNIETSIEKSEFALQNAQDAAYLYYILGELYAKGKNNPQKGLDYFITAQELCPNWDALYVGITYASERLNKPNQPNDLGEEKVGIYKENQANSLDFIEQSLRADKLLFNGEIDMAGKEYEHLMDLYPKNAVAISNYGFFLTQKGNHNDAEEPLLDALKMKTEDPRIYSNLCNFYLTVGNLNDANKYLQKGLQIYPNDVNLGYETARLMALNGQNEAATQQLLLVLKANYPHPQRIKNDLAFADLIKKASFKSALKMYLTL